MCIRTRQKSLKNSFLKYTSFHFSVLLLILYTFIHKVFHVYRILDSLYPALKYTYIRMYFHREAVSTYTRIFNSQMVPRHSQEVVKVSLYT